MSKTYSGGVKLIKNKNYFFKKIVIFLLIVFLLISIVFGGYGLSYLLSNKDISLFNNSRITLKSINYYLLNFGEFDSLDDAKKCAVWTASVGGSAYVYFDNKYVVCGQLYNNYDDINSVINNINKDLTYMPKSMQFKTKTLYFNINKIKQNDKKALVNDINTIDNYLKKLLKVSEMIDKSVISNITASGEVNRLKSEVKILRFSINEINSRYNNENIEKIINLLIKYEDCLDVCVNKLLVSDNYSNAIKYAVCEMFFAYYDMCKNL